MASAIALDHGAILIESGKSPTQVIADLTTQAFDPDSLLAWRSGTRARQYAVAALGFEDSVAVFTGSRTIGWSGSLTGDGVAVQGNLLRGRHVLQATLGTYEDAAASSCSLADRLVAALIAGSEAGGDRRCSASLSALSAYVEVARPEEHSGASSLRLVVTDPRPASTSAWTFLRQMLFPDRGTWADNPVVILASRYHANSPNLSAKTCPALQSRISGASVSEGAP